MSLLQTVIATTLFAGLAMAFGAVMALVEERVEGEVGEVLRHSVMAFGGGALLSAVALVVGRYCLRWLWC